MNPSTRTVDIELAAVNRAFFTQPDVDGYVASYEEVESGGSFVVYTTLPVREIIGECRARRGLPVKPSLSTWLYLCNAAAYLIMRYGLEMRVPAGFLHVPPSTTNYLRRETSHGLPLQDIVESTLCVIEVAIKRGLETA